MNNLELELVSTFGWHFIYEDLYSVFRSQWQLTVLLEDRKDELKQSIEQNKCLKWNLATHGTDSILVSLLNMRYSDFMFVFYFH